MFIKLVVILAKKYKMTKKIRKSWFIYKKIIKKLDKYINNKNERKYKS